MSLLFQRSVPGTSTCILVGGLQQADRLDFSGYRTLLWLTDAGNRSPAPRGIAAERVQVVLIEIAAPGQVEAAIEELVRRDARHMPSVFVTDGRSTQSSPAYRAAIDAVHGELESAHRARITRQLDGFAWQKHILANVGAYVRHRLPAAWAGRLQGLPAFVIAAGPSLDVSGPKLAAAAPRTVVFAVDSALRAASRHGIRADFAVSIDAAKVPEKCLSADRPDRIVLSSVSPRSWQESIPAEIRWFLSGNQITDDWLTGHGVERTAIGAIESCGSTAIELATWMGCDPIYLFGLDLAVDPANQARRHQRDADPGLYTKSNYDPSAALPRVPGNYVETVPCFALGDWRALDARLDSRTRPRIFNVNDRGARLRGTTLVHPNQFTPPAAADDKIARLAALPSSTDVPPETVNQVLARLHAIGGRWLEELPSLRRALERGPAEVAQAFRPIVLDPEGGRALGGFALKLMPHLVPPIEGERPFWEALLNEFAELAELARQAR